MNILISGGCKNGKSYFAQRLAKAQEKDSLYYIATMIPVDEEDEKRILKHKEDRLGFGFETIEVGTGLYDALTVKPHNGSYLLDSVTALLANEMFPKDGPIDLNAYERIIAEFSLLFEKMHHMVIVSDYIYSDAAIYESYTDAYRKGLAAIDRAVAKKCHIVLESVYGNIIVHKGQKEYNEIYEKIS